MNILIFIGHFSLYLVGYIAQVLSQASGSLSSESNSVKKLGQWIEIHAVELSWRGLLAIAGASTVISLVQDTGQIPRDIVYMAAGFSADRLLGTLLFVGGKPIGTRVDTAQIAPSNGNKSNGSDH